MFYSQIASFLRYTLDRDFVRWHKKFKLIQEKA
jgi:hypothetical protein